jgi:hypothetical protein
MIIDEATFPDSTEAQREFGRKLVANAAENGNEIIWFAENVADGVASQKYGAPLAAALQKHFETSFQGGKGYLLAGVRGVQLFQVERQLRELDAKYKAVARELKERRDTAPEPRNGVHGSYRTWPVAIFHPEEGQTVIQHLNDPKKVEIVDRGYVETLSAKRRRTSHERPA